MGYLNNQLKKVASAVADDKKSPWQDYADGITAAAPGALMGGGGIVAGGLTGRYAIGTLADGTPLKGKISPEAIGRLLLDKAKQTGTGNALKYIWKNAPLKGKAALVAAPLLALGSLGAGTAYTWNKLRKLNDK